MFLWLDWWLTGYFCSKICSIGESNWGLKYGLMCNGFIGLIWVFVVCEKQWKGICHWEEEDFGTSFGGFDLTGSIPVNHHHAHQAHTMHHHQTHPRHDGFPLTVGTLQSCDQTISMTDYSKGERSKNSASEEDEPSFAEDGFDGQHEAVRGKKGSPWQRVKWTDKMVKLLITAVSYIGEDITSDGGGSGRRKFAVHIPMDRWSIQDYNKSSYPHRQMVHSDVNQVLPESMRAAWLQKQWIESRHLQLEEQKLQILENERMKLENERIALELKRKEMGIGFN